MTLLHENNPQKVSIIIATYNAAKTLRKALESVYNQKYNNWECLIIDGNSKDKTVSIALEYVEKDNRFKCFSEPDKGIYDAFNKGWRKATGKWIYYLGSDDELLPNGIQSLINCSENADFVYGGIGMKYRSGKIKYKYPDIFEKVMPFSIAASHQAMILTKDKIEAAGGFNLKYKILADYDLINHVYNLGIRTKRCEEYIAIFQLGGISTDNISSLRERYEILISYGVCKLKAFTHCIKMFFLFSLLKIKHHFD